MSDNLALVLTTATVVSKARNRQRDTLSPIVVHAQDAVLVRLDRSLAFLGADVPVTQQETPTRRHDLRPVGMKSEGNLSRRRTQVAHWV